MSDGYHWLVGRRSPTEEAGLYFLTQTNDTNEKLGIPCLDR